MNFLYPSFKYLTAEQSAIVKVLIYFDIFNFPLTSDEIFKLIQNPSLMLSDLEKELSLLNDLGYIQSMGNYFGLYKENFLENIKNREKDAQLSVKMLKKSRFYTSVIAFCPFVRSVCLSGTISKGIMKNDSDIDYFIITKPGRLWIARTILTLFKKIFLLNSYKYFCINYFIDEDNLEIPDKNIFTATELAFLLPVYNYEIYLKIKQKNQWIKRFLPNFENRSKNHLIKHKNFAVKKFFEKLLDLTIANQLEKICFKIFSKYFDKKYDYLDDEVKSLVARHKLYVSKLHPNNFQEKVISNIQSKTEAFEVKYETVVMEFEYKIT